MILSRSVTFSGRDLENSASYWCRERRKCMIDSQELFDVLDIAAVVVAKAPWKPLCAG